jgi:hypothetical protein
LAAARRAEQVHACVQELVGVGVRAQPVASTQSGSLPRHGRTHPGHREAAAGVSGARLEHGELKAAGLAAAATAAAAEPQSARLRVRHMRGGAAHMHLPHVGRPRSQLRLRHERLLPA